jgi:hypothetical protein
MAKPVGKWLRAFLGVAFAAAWALGGSPSTAAPLQLVTDQLIPFENLSDAEAPGAAHSMSWKSPNVFWHGSGGKRLRPRSEAELARQKRRRGRPRRVEAEATRKRMPFQSAKPV